jgi:iron complex outermembrane receptor protein
LTNQQLQYALQPLPGTIGASRASIVNAGKSRIYGVEGDAVLQFGEHVRLTGAANYLNTKLISATAPPFPGFMTIPTAIVGGELPYSPKWSGNVGASFRLPVPETTGRIELGALYRFQSGYKTSGTTPLHTTAVRQVDFNLNWDGVGNGPVDLALFVTNLTKQFTVVTISGLTNSLGFDVRQLGAPRMLGARIRVHLGQSR